ncbi:trypsin-like serine protease [Photobacterium japonica]|uniref:trypsin-like serine protease n=1 Tax=Photobacterium japonica TaxID=2910235 RepID=UPI003D135192
MPKLLFILLCWSALLPLTVNAEEPVFQPRIIGGIESEGGELPWQAYINMTFRDDSGTERTFICGGVVVRQDVVITAAHCMRNGGTTVLPEDVMVWGGITSIFNASRSTSIAVSRVILHPAYNSSRFANDIAILHLRDPLPEGAIPIAIASEAEQDRVDNEFANGWVDNAERVANLLVSGWGSTSVSESNSGSTRLRQTLLSGVPDSRCDQLWGSNINVLDYPIYLCAGSVSPELARDSCFGDSGGPLVWQDPQALADSDFGLRLVGLVSFGEGCAGRLPGVYTETATYRDWIEQNVGALPQQTATYTADPFLSDYSGAGEGEGVIVFPDGWNNDDSGGLMGWLSLLVLGGLARLRRRH